MGLSALFGHYRARLQARVATGPDGIASAVSGTGDSGDAAVNEYRAERNHGLQARFDFIPVSGRFAPCPRQ